MKLRLGQHNIVVVWILNVDELVCGVMFEKVLKNELNRALHIL